MEEQILERVVFHAGKIIIQSGDIGHDSYIIQSGEVGAFSVENNEKVEIARFGPNTIIGESNLLLDARANMTFQAITDTTTVRVVRQDFKKKLNRADKGLQHIIGGILAKIKEMEEEEIARNLRANKVDHKAKDIVDHLLRSMDDERKNRYAKILLPHFNTMIKSLEELRLQEKHERQKENLERKVSEIKDEGAEVITYTANTDAQENAQISTG